MSAKMDSNLHGLLLNSLQEFSTIAVAIHYWSIPSTKERIIQYFTEKGGPKLKDVEVMDDEWHRIIEHVEQQSSVHLPKKLFDKVFNMIFHIGRKTYFWISYAHGCVGVELKNAVQISWTSYGNVNDVQTFHLYWQNDKCMSRFQLYRIAVSFADTQFIKKYLPHMVAILTKMAEFHKKKLPIKECKVYGVMALYVCYSSKNGFQMYEEIKKLKSPAKALFTFCLQNALNKAAKYFYHKIDKNEREATSYCAFSECSQIRKNIRNNYEKDLLSESLFFLLNNFSFAKRTIDVLSNRYFNAFIYETFISVYPYQKLCLPILKSVWRTPFSFGHQPVLKFVLDYTISNPITHRAAKNIFPQILSWMLDELPLVVELIDYLDRPYLEKMLQLNDFDSLSVILNSANDFKSIYINNLAITIVEFFMKKPNLEDITFENFNRYLDKFAFSSFHRGMCSMQFLMAEKRMEVLRMLQRNHESALQSESDSDSWESDSDSWESD